MNRDSGSVLFRSQMGQLLFLTSIFFLNFISRIIFSPLMPAIEKEIGISHVDAGSLFLVISIGYFVALLGSGFVSSILTHKKTIIISAMILGLSLLEISLCDNLWGIRLGLLCLGMGAGLYLPSGIATLTSIISSKHWGKAIAVHELAPNLSFVLAPLIAEAFLACCSWRFALRFIGILSILLSIAFARWGKGEKLRGQPPGFRSFRTLFMIPSFWFMMLLFSLGISGTLGIYTMLPLYLISEHGIDRNWANTLLALSRISGLWMAFLSGWSADRLGPKRTIGAVLLLTGIMTLLLGIASSSSIVVLVFLQPVIAVCFFPPAFALLSLIGPLETRNVAVSLTVPAAFLFGGGIIPIIIGIMGDSGAFSLGVSIVGGLILAGFFLSFLLKYNEQEKSLVSD
ncbi:MAG TPA: MFS transporter [Desulfobacteraceae bacterium]|nr:MFS transporter [Desulfobacteraceae bacterium]HPJ66763.1 MFS transporter [Desulfobacteraceae bacterium]HPQ26973.1 MFS transporter [Desulfobacteraceae bacterium]